MIILAHQQLIDVISNWHRKSKPIFRSSRRASSTYRSFIIKLNLFKFHMQAATSIKNVTCEMMEVCECVERKNIIRVQFKCNCLMHMNFIPVIVRGRKRDIYEKLSARDAWECDSHYARNFFGMFVKCDFKKFYLFAYRVKDHNSKCIEV